MLIPSPTEESAQAGIKTFASKLLTAVKYCLNKIMIPNFDLNSEIATNLIDGSNGMIIKIG